MILVAIFQIISLWSSLHWPVIHALNKHGLSHCLIWWWRFFCVYNVVMLMMIIIVFSIFVYHQYLLWQHLSLPKYEPMVFLQKDFTNIANLWHQLSVCRLLLYHPLDPLTNFTAIRYEVFDLTPLCIHQIHEIWELSNLRLWCLIPCNISILFSTASFSRTPF